MSDSVVLFHLAGTVALLLFATCMIPTGVALAYGDVLRHKLRNTMSNQILAVLSNASLVTSHQSSTAVTLLSAPLPRGGGIASSIAGQFAVRGGKIGSALVIKVLTFDLPLAVPICLAASTTMFLATDRRRWQQTGSILIGIGLLVLSLKMFGQAPKMLRESIFLPVIVDYFAGDPVTAHLLPSVVT